MTLRARPMRSEDVAECATIIATHPVIGARYGRTIQHLQSAWSRVLGYEAKTTAVVENVEGPRSTICFVGVSLIVSDDFVRELKTPPLVWFGPELVKRILRGDSPVLSDKELAKANVSGGLNLLVWEGCPRFEFVNEPELPRLVMERFIEDHRGFRWKEVISSQLESAQRLQFTLGSGCLLWDPENGRYVKPSASAARSAARRPHLVGFTRNLEFERRPWGTSWVGALFDYHPPQFSFSPSEQRLLLAALGAKSGTDRELADLLGASLPTIKKMWLSIYRRVSDRKPEIIRDPFYPETEKCERGKEKRRRLLAYLREHPEELRPAARKRP